MFINTKKIIDRSVYFVVPALVSLINLTNFVAVPLISNFDEYSYFIAINVYAGFYLNLIASGAHNISAVQFAVKDSKVLPTYQALSIFVALCFVPASFLLLDTSYFVLVFAYLIQQQIVIMVMIARHDFDGVRAKAYLLIQPLLMLLLVLGLGWFEIEKFWIYSSLLSALVGAGAVMKLEKVSFKVLLPRISLNKESVIKTILILVSGSGVPLFIHLDMLLLRDSSNLSEFAIFGKFAYSIPMSLSSLLIYRVFKDKKFIKITHSALHLSIVALFSTASWVAYTTISDFSFKPNFLLVFFYILVFGIYNFILSIAILKDPKQASRLALISTVMLSTFLVGNFGIVSYMIIKMVIMIFVITLYLNRTRT